MDLGQMVLDVALGCAVSDRDAGMHRRAQRGEVLPRSKAANGVCQREDVAAGDRVEVGIASMEQYARQSPREMSASIGLSGISRAATRSV